MRRGSSSMDEGSRWKGKAPIATSSGSCSSTSKGRRCRCGSKAVLYRAKQGLNKGKYFWRCPIWMTPETCDFFDWYDENEKNEEVGNKAVIDAIALAMEILEEGKKKQAEILEEGKKKNTEILEKEKKKYAKMQKKINEERFYKNLFLTFIVFSLLLNVYLAMN